MTISPVVACKSGDPPPPPFRTPPLPPLYSFLSSSGVKLRVSVRGTSDSAPTSSLSSHLSSLSLPFLLCSLSPSLPLQSIPLCPDHLPPAHCFPFFSLVQWLYERSAVWSQARLVEEVKAEVGTLSLSLFLSSSSFFPCPFLSSSGSGKEALRFSNIAP